LNPDRRIVPVIQDAERKAAAEQQNRFERGSRLHCGTETKGSADLQSVETVKQSSRTLAAQVIDLVIAVRRQAELA
jgi:hypothetical protein